jgi:hypothetical protein
LSKLRACCHESRSSPPPVRPTPKVVPPTPAHHYFTNATRHLPAPSALLRTCSARHPPLPTSRTLPAQALQAACIVSSRTASKPNTGKWNTKGRAGRPCPAHFTFSRRTCLSQRSDVGGWSFSSLTETPELPSLRSGHASLASQVFPSRYKRPPHSGSRSDSRNTFSLPTRHFKHSSRRWRQVGGPGRHALRSCKNCYRP